MASDIISYDEMLTVPLAYDVFESIDVNPDLPPIILQHGFMWNKFMFRQLARDICEATSRKVFIIDQRNHGESPWCEKCTMSLMIEDTKRFICEQYLKKVSFICHSASCTVAYMITLEKPELVEKLLLIDSPPFNFFYEEYRQINAYPPLIAQNKLLRMLSPRMTLKEAKQKCYQLAKCGNTAQKYFFRKCAYDLTKVNGKFKWKKDLDQLMNLYNQGAFYVTPKGTCNHEILIARADNSTHLPEHKLDEILRHNPNTRIVNFENTTHLLMFEEQEKFVHLTKEFFSTS